MRRDAQVVIQDLFGGNENATLCNKMDEHKILSIETMVIGYWSFHIGPPNLKASNVHQFVGCDGATKETDLILLRWDKITGPQTIFAADLSSENISCAVWC